MTETLVKRHPSMQNEEAAGLPPATSIPQGRWNSKR